MKNSAGPIIVSALILAAAVVFGSSMLSKSVDQATAELAGLKASMGEMKDAVKTAATAAAKRPEPSPQRARRGPDPEKVYTVNVKGSPVKGPESAQVTLVEFSDFQCPFCSRVTPTLNQIREEYGDKVRVVFKHLPLDFHTKAPAAHAASEAAHKQGKFWEMHDKIFGNQRELTNEKYEEYAAELGLDVAQFKKDIASASVKQRIDADKAEATKLGVSGTPGFFVNGRFLSGAQPLASFKRLIDAELAKNG